MLYYHLYKILYLEIHIPIKITDSIFLLPHKDSLNESDYRFSFNKEEYSYLLIISKEDEEVPKCDEEKINRVKTILSLILANQFYNTEYLNFEVKYSVSRLIIGKITTNFKSFVRERSSLIHLNIIGFQSILNRIYEDLETNPLSSSLFNFTSTLMAFLRENVFELAIILGGTFIEYISAHYWRNNNPEFLLNITETAFKRYSELLKIRAEDFFKSELKKDEILLKDEYTKPDVLRGLLFRGLSPNVINFSPAKYRFYSLLKNENMEDEDFEQNVKLLYKMRNDIVHDGKNLEDIKADPTVDIDPIKFLEVIKLTLYRFFLHYLGITEKHLEFKNGRLIIKNGILDLSGMTAEEIEAELKNNAEENQKVLDQNKSMMEVLNYREDKLIRLKEIDSICEFSWGENTQEVSFHLDFDEKEEIFEIKIFDPPYDFLLYWYSSPFQSSHDYPEENVRLQKPYTFKFEFEENIILVISHQIFGTNIDMIKHLFNREIEDEYMIFRVEEILIKRLNP